MSTAAFFMVVPKCEVCGTLMDRAWGFRIVDGERVYCTDWKCSQCVPDGFPTFAELIQSASGDDQ